MFYYHGRKARAAKSYPAPAYPLVIEPFAGSMAYTLHHRPPFAIGIELDASVAEVWRRLCALSIEELAAYPLPAVGERFTDKWLLLSDQSSGGTRRGYRTMSQFMVERAETLKRMALKHHDYAVGSVLYHHGDYRSAPDVEACWFIDPPYQGPVDAYRHNSLDYEELAEWCLRRRGQVIVCEGWSASWLPFAHHSTRQGLPMFGHSNTVITEKVLTRRTHARCAHCDITFPATRSDARFCSGKCRVAASRRRGLPQIG